MSTGYYYYITNEDGVNKLCIVYDDGNTHGTYNGDAKLFYTKLADIDTTDDNNVPTIEGRWHFALVFGALMLMGFPQFGEFFRSYIKQARGTKSKVRHGSLVLYYY